MSFIITIYFTVSFNIMMMFFIISEAMFDK
jgi:hypothetical protein